MDNKSCLALPENFLEDFLLLVSMYVILSILSLVLGKRNEAVLCTVLNGKILVFFFLFGCISLNMMSCRVLLSCIF